MLNKSTYFPSNSCIFLVQSMTVPPVMHEASRIIFHAISLRISLLPKVMIVVPFLNIIPIDGNKLISIWSGLNMKETNGVDELMLNGVLFQAITTVGVQFQIMSTSTLIAYGCTTTVS